MDLEEEGETISFILIIKTVDNLIIFIMPALMFVKEVLKHFIH